MDAQRELRKITAGTPPELARKLIKTVVDTSVEDNIRAIIADRKTPYKQAEKLKRLLESGAFRREDTVVDEDVARELDKYNSVMVDKFQRQGKLDDPMTDRFFHDRMHKLRNMKRK